ncbi:DinB family protein [Paenibacillus sp. HJGM_3]|uniref:DinB family protein n=1 Tax=Paenibacillus sp. HJGM_3 TaxID=3379816 RepID=UPI00385C5647
MSHYAIQMYDFNCWATQTLINRLKELSDSVYRQPLTSVFPSVSHALAHIYMVEWTWFRIIEGQTMQEAMAAARAMQAELESMSLEELEEKFHRLFQVFKARLEELPDLEATVTLDNPYTRIRETKLAEMVLQVVNHSTYHRGNITAMLRQMELPSVMTEYALYWYSA